jgi:predicted cupin superfamily sugar epimerase
MTVDFLVKHLELVSHPEGGFYKETYRSLAKAPQQALPKGFQGDRNFATAIYFLIERDNFSALHKIKSDETWHFYAGHALEVIELDEHGNLTTTPIGNDIAAGETFQYTVKANTWFGSRVKAGGSFSLVGCTVSPGFDFADFEMANRMDLIEKFPQHAHIIAQMTRSQD